MGFFVKFWGVRGSIPTPGWQTRRYGGNTTCVEVRVDDHLIICDGGTGLRELGVSLLKKHKGPLTAHFLFSHPHWDHIQGFPFFAPLYDPKNTFYIYGRDESDQKHFELLSGQMHSDYFPVEFQDVGANVVPTSLASTKGMLGSVKVETFMQPHPGGSLAYSFEAHGKKVVFATDNELDMIIENPEEVAKDSFAHRKISKPYIDFIRGADLLVADGQYTDEEYPQRRGWGHARATTVVDAALEADVHRLAITHHDPMQSDEDVDAKIKVCRERVARFHRSLVVFPAREKVELRIDQGEFEAS